MKSRTPSPATSAARWSGASKRKPTSKTPDASAPGKSKKARSRKPPTSFISGREDWKDIDNLLRQSLAAGLREMAKLYPFFGVNRFKDIGYNLQRYQPGEYYHWHVDSGPGGIHEPSARRHLVFK